MDIAGRIFASKTAGGRCATVAIDAMTFKKSVLVGEVMCICTDLIRIGTISISVHGARVLRSKQAPRFLVTEGKFVYVALAAGRALEWRKGVIGGQPARVG
jgi:acyl-CoA thioesterase YciA